MCTSFRICEVFLEVNPPPEEDLQEDTHAKTTLVDIEAGLGRNAFMTLTMKRCFFFVDSQTF